MLTSDYNLSTVESLFENENVKTIVLPTEPEKTRFWFRASDVCAVLFSKGNAYQHVQRHCKPEQYREFQDGNGRPANYVSLSGALRLALRSKAPCAVAFQDWLTEECLPKLIEISN